MNPWPVVGAPAWPVAWAQLFPRLVEQLPGEALAPLRVAFTLSGAASVDHFFALLNNKNFFTGTDAKRNTACLLSVVSRYDFPVVSDLRDAYNRYFTRQELLQMPFREFVASHERIRRHLLEIGVPNYPFRLSTLYSVTASWHDIFLALKRTFPPLRDISGWRLDDMATHILDEDFFRGKEPNKSISEEECLNKLCNFEGLTVKIMVDALDGANKNVAYEIKAIVGLL